jgi:glycosyltransferase involved in cell wall biosynthesis
MNSTNPHDISVFLASTMRTPFIQDDIDILTEHFALSTFAGSGGGSIWRFFRGAMRADVNISWFASVYTFFMVLGARIGGKKSIIILGGVDTAKEPSMNYGIWRSWWKPYLLRYALRHAEHVLAVDASLKESLRNASGWSGDSIEVLPTGYDPEEWKPGGNREKMVLCVAVCDSQQRIQIKGIDTLIEAARQLPDARFRIIGITPDSAATLASSLPANVELLPPIPRTELLAHYQQAKVYCQPSRREGLPNTLCEAMLCGCIPVGTRVGGIPTAIDGVGFLSESGDAAQLARNIATALDAPDDAGSAARARIMEQFHRERRERRLVELITELAHA